MSHNKQILDLLKSYPDLARKVSILRYELQHLPSLSPEDMIDTMNFSHQEGTGHNSGAVSNKTMYIALNYREQSRHANHECFDEIAMRLIPLEQEIRRLEHYVSLLNSRMALIIRMHYFEEQPWEVIASKLDLSVRRVQYLKNAAVDKLSEMYEFALYKH